MKVYVLLSDSSNVPLAIYDDFDKAKKHLLEHPTKHLCIFEYELNSTKPGKNIYDHYFNQLFSI